MRVSGNWNWGFRVGFICPMGLLWICYHFFHKPAVCQAFLRGEKTGDLILPFLRGHFAILVAHCFPRNAWHSGYSFIAYYNTVLENGSNFVPQTQSHRATWHNNDLVSHATSKRTSPDKMIESPSVASDNQTSWSCPLNVHIKEVRLYYWRGKPINSHCTQYDSLTCIWYIPWTGKPWGVFAE